jgi:predicted SnoaL-like aldol condensation-catalyzing enzyme
MDAEPEWFFDSVAEFFTRNPGARSKLVACFREGDFLQVGSVMDEAFISYITVKCAEFWESEVTQVQEQESDYQGDE